MVSCINTSNCVIHHMQLVTQTIELLVRVKLAKRQNFPMQKRKNITIHLEYVYVNDSSGSL